MSNILLLAGSPSAPSRSTGILHLVAKARARVRRFHHAFGSPHHPLGQPPVRRREVGGLKRAHALVADAGGLVVASPVYKAAYSGLLKTFLDFLPDGFLRGKTVYPIATGGSPAHLLSVDYALKPVFSVLGASRILEGLYATNDAIAMHDDGSATLRDELDARLRAGIAGLWA